MSAKRTYRRAAMASSALAAALLAAGLGIGLSGAPSAQSGGWSSFGGRIETKILKAEASAFARRFDSVSRLCGSPLTPQGRRCFAKHGVAVATGGLSASATFKSTTNWLPTPAKCRHIHSGPRRLLCDISSLGVNGGGDIQSQTAVVAPTSPYPALGNQATFPTITSSETVPELARLFACDFGESATNLCLSETQLSVTASIRICVAHRSLDCIVNVVSAGLRSR